MTDIMVHSAIPRFWYPHGQELRLSDHGFLWDPFGSFTQHVNPDLVQLGDLRGAGCTVLLGDAGLGKSTVLMEETEAVRATGEAHRSYAEFLAAEYLLVHRVPMSQLRPMLSHPDASDRLVPQLWGVVAWLASRGDILDLIRQQEPQLLFSVDVAEHGEADRASVVDAILQAARSGRLSDFSLSHVQLRRPAHDNVALQLLPVIRDRSRHRIERRLAMYIAGQCCLPQVEEALLAVALDTTDDLHFRAVAAAILTNSTNGDVRRRLGQLLGGNLAEDTQDELRGYALRAVWPGLYSVSQLLPHITPPKDEQLFGGYYSFLDNIFVEGLQPSDLPAVVGWLTTLPEDQFHRSPFSEIRDRVYIRSLENLDTPGLAPVLAVALWQKVQRHDGWSFGDGIEERLRLLFQDTERRRRVLKLMLSSLPGGRSHWLEILSFQPPLLTRGDLHWLIEQLDGESNPGIRRILADLVGSYLSTEQLGDFDLILRTRERHAELREAVAPLVDPVPLNSPQAQRMREDFAARLEWQSRRQQPPVLDPPPQVRVVRLLDSIRPHDTDTWPLLTMELTLTPTSTHYGPEFPSDVTQSPGWQNADSETRTRLCRLADTRRLMPSTLQESQRLFEEQATALSRDGLRLMAYIMNCSLR